MSQHVNQQSTDEDDRDTTMSFRADLDGQLDASAAAVAEAAGLDELPGGSALLVVKHGPNAGSSFLLDHPVTSLGRDPRSDIVLDDATISRQHAELRRQSPTVRIVDLGSLNGTYVNGKPVQSAVLNNRDEIQIGKFRLVFISKPTTG